MVTELPKIEQLDLAPKTDFEKGIEAKHKELQEKLNKIETQTNIQDSTIATIKPEIENYNDSLKKLIKSVKEKNANPDNEKKQTVEFANAQQTLDATLNKYLPKINPAKAKFEQLGDKVKNAVNMVGENASKIKTLTDKMDAANKLKFTKLIEKDVKVLLFLVSQIDTEIGRVKTAMPDKTKTVDWNSIENIKIDEVKGTTDSQLTIKFKDLPATFGYVSMQNSTIEMFKDPVGKGYNDYLTDKAKGVEATFSKTSEKLIDTKDSKIDPEYKKAIEGFSNSIQINSLVKMFKVPGYTNVTDWESIVSLIESYQDKDLTKDAVEGKDKPKDKKNGVAFVQTMYEQYTDKTTGEGKDDTKAKYINDAITYYGKLKTPPEAGIAGLFRDILSTKVKKIYGAAENKDANGISSMELNRPITNRTDFINYLEAYNSTDTNAESKAKRTETIKKVQTEIMILKIFKDNKDNLAGIPDTDKTFINNRLTELGKSTTVDTYIKDNYKNSLSSLLADLNVGTSTPANGVEAGKDNLIKNEVLKKIESKINSFEPLQEFYKTTTATDAEKSYVNKVIMQQMADKYKDSNDFTGDISKIDFGMSKNSDYNFQLFINTDKATLITYFGNYDTEATAHYGDSNNLRKILDDYRKNPNGPKPVMPDKPAEPAKEKPAPTEADKTKEMQKEMFDSIKQMGKIEKGDSKIFSYLPKGGKELIKDNQVTLSGDGILKIQINKNTYEIKPDSGSINFVDFTNIDSKKITIQGQIFIKAKDSIVDLSELLPRLDQMSKGANNITQIVKDTGEVLKPQIKIEFNKI